MDISILTLQAKFLKRRDSTTKGLSASDASSLQERVRNLFSIPPSVRTDSQTTAVLGFVKNLKFFAELRDAAGEYAQFQCCRYLTYTHFAAGKCVFREGEIGSQFYIILSGSCSIITKTANSTDFQLLTILRSGDSFGELSLISNRPRAATVFCREACSFAVLEQQDYAEILKQVQERQLKDKIALLRQHPVFSTWKLEDVTALSHFFHPRPVKRKQVLFSAGQPASELFLIQEGSFHESKEVSQMVFTSGLTKAMRKQIEVTPIGPGELLCVSSSLVMGLYHSSCVCQSATGSVLVIDAKNFKRMVSSEEVVNALIEAEAKKKEQQRKKNKEDEECKRGIRRAPIRINKSVVVKPKCAGTKAIQQSIHVFSRQFSQPQLSKPNKPIRLSHKRTVSIPVDDSSVAERSVVHQRFLSVTDPSELDIDSLVDSLDDGTMKAEKLPLLPQPVSRAFAKTGLRLAGLSRNASLPSLSFDKPSVLA